MAGVRSGQPVIRGTRVTVWDILGWFGGRLSEAEVLQDFPNSNWPISKPRSSLAISSVSNPRLEASLRRQPLTPHRPSSSAQFEKSGRPFLTLWRT